ncbi:serine protease inhibitor 42Dd-like isoform X1 [Anastrepha ludens]|uniref:serine protease inhibitor 42Dd-like isoform X1 n=2 Tax=Anastrepha ludens TaxID=28586 RepID=UPI0023AF7414|nr:serine protease inhibitor 42Dd-like isoform X1 [Anastrepha ludens]XP_053966752.1 serine protease inhibitor 42Dd-like isoform X1 [Anastrepha ludens]XP_053966753.1 serine protease inhibitor 42Dd-like isoform X1 [Anastrepha ludens]
MPIRFLVLFIAIMATATPIAGSSPFATQLFQAIVSERPKENVIVSPVSIETCLALAYLGAEGQTAEELAAILQLPRGDKESIAPKFAKLFERIKSGSRGTAIFRLANRIYLDQRFQLSSNFNEIAESQLHSKAENVYFAEADISAEKINSWVEEQTENRIQHLVSANSLDVNTAVLLVNALYLKAKWVNQFENDSTSRQDFFVGVAQKVKVEMMKQSDQFLYAEYKELDASAIEMKYADTDVSMLVVLPNVVDGLASLEEKLKNIDLIQLFAAMSLEEVVVQLPKFKFELNLSLKPVLEQLGVSTMFSDKADFSSMLAKKDNLAISEAKHKAFIEVNESGTEAAAATYLKFVPLSAKLTQHIYQFVADHPFVFAIKDNENVYFIGHVTNF